MDTDRADTLNSGDRFIWYDNTYTVLGCYAAVRLSGWVEVAVKERVKPFKFPAGTMLSISRNDGGPEY